jgi:acyl-CoA reductase-like NAD-dependent aldehyde dehydrogenase
MTRSQVDDAVQKAHDAFPSWKKTPVAERVKVLSKFCTLFESKKDEISETITSQMGRPIRYGVGEVKGTLERATYMISVAEACLQDEVVESSDKFRRYLRKEPLGAVFIIAAWNYPYLTTVNNVVPALLAGNTVLLKHSPQTPKCGDLFVDTLREAGVPHDAIQSVHVNDEEANYLVQHPLVQFVNFTGSVAVGKNIRQSIGDSRRIIGKSGDTGKEEEEERRKKN